MLEVLAKLKKTLKATRELSGRGLRFNTLVLPKRKFVGFRSVSSVLTLWIFHYFQVKAKSRFKSKVKLRVVTFILPLRGEDNVLSEKQNSSP